MSSGAPTVGGLKRLTYDPTNDNFGDLIAGQNYWDVQFTGGTIQNVLLENCTFSPPITGGGYSHELTLSTGLSINVPNVGTMVNLNSATAGAKSATIPASTGSKQIITFFDFIGTCDPDQGGNPLTVTPVTGSITGNDQLYTKNGRVTFYDSALGWTSI